MTDAFEHTGSITLPGMIDMPALNKFKLRLGIADNNTGKALSKHCHWDWNCREPAADAHPDAAQKQSAAADGNQSAWCPAGSTALASIQSSTFLVAAIVHES